MKGVIQILGSVLMWLGVFCLFLFAVGLISESFLLFYLSLLACSLFLISGYLVNRKKKNSDDMFMLGLGIIALLVSFYYFEDALRYLNKDYEILEGVPSDIYYGELGGRFGGVTTINVSIDDKLMTLFPKPPYSVEELKGRYIKIYYLPKTKFLQYYEIDGKVFELIWFD